MAHQGICCDNSDMSDLSQEVARLARRIDALEAENVDLRCWVQLA
jgi:hypothetical protein